MDEKGTEQGSEIEQAGQSPQTVKEKPQTRERKKKRKKSSVIVWTIEVFFITLLLTFSISMVSETVMTNAHIAVAILVLLLIIAINILFDLVGVAFASGDIAPFLSMSSRKIKGAKMCVRLLKNSDRVCNICSDIIGDICGIVSGSAGAVIAISLSASLGYVYQIIVAIVTSSLIAALTVCGKSLIKSAGIRHSHKIVFFIGRLLSVFGNNK